MDVIEACGDLHIKQKHRDSKSCKELIVHALTQYLYIDNLTNIKILWRHRIVLNSPTRFASKDAAVN